ncbi:MAG: glycosyltransferase [Candidatus Melainabacteria bacterium]|nr:glycosyltransferase [Candidatus Melainabacteria bacterium]
MTASPVIEEKTESSVNRTRHQWEKAKKPPTFCVILPVCNAQHQVAKRVTSIIKILENIHVRTAVIVVNDGSTDETAMVLGQLSEVYAQLIVIERPERSGYGSANRAGFRAAIDHGYDYALVLDGEVPANPESIDRFLRPMLLSYDFIKATRFSPYSQVEGVGLMRQLLSVLCNRLMGMMIQLPITDYSNGIRAIKCTLLARMMTEEIGPSILLEEVMQGKRLGAKFFEVPHLATGIDNQSLYSAFPSLADYGRYLKHLLG